MDEAGFAPTLPTGYSWSPVGVPLKVPYEPPSGRRVNVIGGYFSHGPDAGRFESEAWVNLPESPAKTPRKSLEDRARAQGVPVEAVGKLDAERVVSFLWRLAGRPLDRGEGDPAIWRRERPLMIVLDNYSVHHSQTIQDAKPFLEAADVYLVYLPSYSPELSEIEPIWKAIKYHEIIQRSHSRLGDLLLTVKTALATKATKLSMIAKSSHLLHRPT